jgi:hypothetical protein
MARATGGHLKKPVLAPPGTGISSSPERLAGDRPRQSTELGASPAQQVRNIG